MSSAAVTRPAGRQSDLRAALWAYLRHELLYLAWALMDVSLLLPVALSALRWAALWPPVAFGLWMLVMVLLPFNVSRLLTIAGTPLKRQRQIILGALLLTIVISIRTLLYDPVGLFDMSWVGQLFRQFVEPANPLWGRNVGLFLLLLFLWWRGLSLTRRRVDIREMGLRLRVSSLIVAPLVAGIAALYDVPVLGALLFYFFVSLVAVSLTRAEQIALERTGRSYPVQGRWLAIIGLTSLLIVAAAGLVALVLSGRGLAQMVSWTAPLWEGLRFFTTALVSIVSYLAFLMLTPVFWLVDRLAGYLRSLNFALPELDVDTPLLEQTDVETLLREMARPEEPVYLWVTRLLLVLFMALLLFLAYQAVSRFLAARQLGVPDEERDKTLRGERRPLGFRRRLGQRLRFWQQWRAAASIRRLYQEMSALAASYGFPRAGAQTPYEYRQTLAELWPQGQAESDLITQAYVRVRYGELPESAEELQALQRAWEHLRRQPPPE